MFIRGSPLFFTIRLYSSKETFCVKKLNKLPARSQVGKTPDQKPDCYLEWPNIATILSLYQAITT